MLSIFWTSKPTQQKLVPPQHHLNIIHFWKEKTVKTQLTALMSSAYKALKTFMNNEFYQKITINFNKYTICRGLIY